MNISRASRRYAKALLDLSKEKSVLDEVATDLTSIGQIIRDSAEFIHLLESPVIENSEKRKAFSELFTSDVQETTFQFLMFLIEKNREALLPDIIRNFQKIYDAERGIIRGELLTARSFSEEQLEALKKNLDEMTGKDVVIDQRLDEALLGGFMIRMEDQVIDTSLKNQLNKLRDKLFGDS